MCTWKEFVFFGWVQCSINANYVKLVGCVTPTFYAAAAAKSLQSCPTLCDPIDSSPPGFPVPGILEARTLEWVAISFSNAWKWKVKVKSLSHVWLLVTPWTAAYQAPPSMGFIAHFRQTFSGCGQQGLLFVAVCGLLIAVALLVVEHRFWVHRL